MEKKIARRLKVCSVIFAVIATIFCSSLIFSDRIEKVLGLRTQKTYASFTEVSTSKFVVHFIDVGQGSSVLVFLPDGKTMLVDAGPEEAGSKLVHYLKNQKVKKIDYLVATHSDEDHVGGMNKVLSNFEVAKIYRPFILANNPKLLPSGDPLLFLSEELEITEVESPWYSAFIELAYKEICAGEKAEIIVSHDGLVLMSTDAENPYIVEFHNPSILEGYEASPIFHMTADGFFTTGYPTEKYSDINSYSPIITIAYLSEVVVLTGDATATTENEVLTSWDETEKSFFSGVTILAASHHGSNSSSTESFLRALLPKYVVVQCGENNLYGHPGDKFLMRLKMIWNEKQVQGTVLRTDKDGNITFGLIPNEELTEVSVLIHISGKRTSQLRYWHLVLGVVILSAVVLFVPVVFEAFGKRKQFKHKA